MSKLLNAYADYKVALASAKVVAKTVIETETLETLMVLGEEVSRLRQLHSINQICVMLGNQNRTLLYKAYTLFESSQVGLERKQVKPYTIGSTEGGVTQVFIGNIEHNISFTPNGVAVLPDSWLVEKDLHKLEMYSNIVKNVRDNRA